MDLPGSVIERQHVCPATNPTALPKKVKISPKTLPTITGNPLTAFPARLLIVFANLLNHFFKVFSYLGRKAEPPYLPSPQKTPVIASTVVEIVTDGVVSVDTIVIPCSQNKVRILPVKYVSLSRTFSRVCLILATCV